MSEQQSLELSADAASINGLTDHHETEGQAGSPRQAEDLIHFSKHESIPVLTAYLRRMDKLPEDWEKLNGAGKRERFQLLVCPQAPASHPTEKGAEPMEQQLELSADPASINHLRDRDEAESQAGSLSQTNVTPEMPDPTSPIKELTAYCKAVGKTRKETPMSETPTSKALKKGREEAPVTPEMPDPQSAPIKELTAYCKTVGQIPEGWTKIKAPEKRVAFQRLFCPQVTEGFDPSDKLHLIAERVENMKEAELPHAVRRLTEDVGDNYFELGGVFARVKAEGWYVEAGYENFKKWVLGTTDMKHAKAHYLVQIYEKLSRLDVPWAKFAGIGWSKVKTLLSVLTSENVDEWVEKAREMTYLELMAAVKAAKGPKVGDGDGDGGEDSILNKGFKFHREQWDTVEAALEGMKGELPTDFDNVAMEHICAAYLTGQVELKDVARTAPAGEPTSMEEFAAGLKAFYEWIKANSETPYEACCPIVDVFEAVFSTDEATIEILLAKAKASRAKLSRAERDLAMTKADHHHAVRTLHLAGGSLREVAAALGVSHQRVQQIVNSAGGSWWSRAWRNQRARPDMLCSFCGLPPGEVAKLIAGPRVYICDGCVELAERAVESGQAAVSERATLARMAAGSRAKCSFCGKRATGGSQSGTCRVCPPCLRLCRQILDDRGEPTPA